MSTCLLICVWIYYYLIDSKVYLFREMSTKLFNDIELEFAREAKGQK